MRTFIFGAGASVHAGYPLASQLWQCLEHWVLTSSGENDDFRRAVETMNTEFDLSKSFELVLTDLDERIDLLLKEKPTAEARIREKVALLGVRTTVQMMIPYCFNSLRAQPAEIYKVFANDVLAPRDAIITFNYDLALDRELKKSGKWSIGNGYGFVINGSSPEDSPCKLFKLHGSTNWRGEVFQGRLGFAQVSPTSLSLGQRPVIEPSEFEYLGYDSMTDSQCRSGRARIESLIMPTANKKFFIDTSFGPEWKDFWDFLWIHAGEALNRSNEVHLIGYSLPSYDTRARELLATRIDENAIVTVCSHNGTLIVVDSVKELLSLRNVDVRPACASSFEDWVLRFKQDSDRESGRM